MRIVFFGSFQHYSALILESLIQHPDIEVVGVVTTPPMPVGRKQIITKTPVHLLAESHSIPVLTPKDLRDERVEDSLANNVDFFITAGYGKILPKSWLQYPSQGSLNLHFSLLPAYRGANPAEWAIMCGETKTGITLINMSAKLDAGDIIEQRELPINSSDTRETLYQQLYSLGAEELPQMLIRYHHRTQKNQFNCQQSLAPKPQPDRSTTPYAALLKREDGFIPWPTIQKYLKGQALSIEDFPSRHLKQAFKFFKQQDFLSRLPRALAGYPSLWTIISTSKGNKRMKIISFSPFTVQVEGKTPAQFNQVKNLIIDL